ncbi:MULTISPECIES: hypothetical protein [Pseudomonas syringae group]|uniref:Uncharacterized protein n=2 Tax=Viruses TaxID=10239 RepID=A0A8E7FPI2_9CAUD|nr:MULTISPECIES: hypothetical protein [Pseudomonas syringae group]YP_010772992.1 hypothetical protein QIT78_gp62 [Pseudomonas phage Medea1]KPB83851.1 Uncharacterized protein Precursor [Pseudomonas syringae pv. maculicola]MBI6849080.1 hypothetical protein [Pseudomonas syringae]MBX6510511.1 hypothetical protein [Pseudomonas syringae pv. tomato]QVW29129.1 hypothetical protein Medea1_0062 [Pseudomonas phage Medea1]RMV03416.1 hypothetical protein ALP19_101484 [Pseudomonas syringae pv. tomato]
MTTPVVKSLIDEQLEEIARSWSIVSAGLPREIPVSSLPPRLVEAVKTGRIAVRPRQ